MKKTITKIILLFSIGLMTSTAIAETNAFIRRGKIKQRPNHTYKVVTVINKKVEGLATIKATIAAADKESPEPKIKEFEMTFSGVNKNGKIEPVCNFVCEKGICLFGGQNVLQKSYTVTIQFLDKAGKQIGEKESFTAAVEYDNEVITTKINVKTLSLVGLNYFAPNSTQNESDDIFITKAKGSNQLVYFKVEDQNKSKEGRTFPGEIYLNAQTAVDDLRGLKTSNYDIPAKYNPKTDRYEATFPDLDSFYLKKMNIRTEVNGGDNQLFEVRIGENGRFKIESISNGVITVKTRKDKSKEEDGQDSTGSCSGNYRLIENGGSIIFNDNSTATISISSTIEVGAKEGKPIGDLTLEIIVHLTNCDGKKINIGIPAKYNEKTKSYYASQALPKCSSGTYTISSLTYKTTDSCGNTSSWVRNWQWGLTR